MWRVSDPHVQGPLCCKYLHTTQTHLPHWTPLELTVARKHAELIVANTLMPTSSKDTVYNLHQLEFPVRWPLKCDPTRKRSTCYSPLEMVAPQVLRYRLKELCSWVCQPYCKPYYRLPSTHLLHCYSQPYTQQWGKAKEWNTCWPNDRTLQPVSRPFIANF